MILEAKAGLRKSQKRQIKAYDSIGTREERCSRYVKAHRSLRTKRRKSLYLEHCIAWQYCCKVGVASLLKKQPLTSTNSAQTPELQSLLAGQIARALAVFCVDEVVIFDDGHAKTVHNSNGDSSHTQEGGVSKESYTGYSDPNYFLTHILAYLETPPYLRKHLFPIHPDLRHAGSLPSLDMPHHIPHRKEKRMWQIPPGHSYIDTGLRERVFVPSTIPPNTRVTVKFKDIVKPEMVPGRELLAHAVAPSAPREEAGYYWGYSVRSAGSLSSVLTECPFDGGYDLTFGTSERGIPLPNLNDTSSGQTSVPEFHHLLIVFGGVAGLEVAVKADEELEHLGVKSPEALFDHWVNLCPGQGSRTIRTEEAVWLGLVGLRGLVVNRGKR